MVLAHWDDIPFERAIYDIPLALVDHKWRLSVITGILVRLGYNPCGGIRNSLKIDKFSPSPRTRDVGHLLGKAPFLFGQACEDRSLFPQLMCPNPTNERRGYRYKKSSASSS